jgi:putative ABC transport system permease protein
VAIVEFDETEFVRHMSNLSQGTPFELKQMNFIALKMLIGDRAKYIGIIIGLTFASLLITQQSAIFVGIMTRTYSFLTDVGMPDIWVVDPQVQYIEDIKPLRDTEVLRVRGTEGIQCAVPWYKGSLDARLDNGTSELRTHRSG